ncbi:MAG TPA: MFS transporter [Capillimicrobium sp.]|nr:MFS transporter [Capillimicrobium sp.]
MSVAATRSTAARTPPPTGLDVQQAIDRVGFGPFQRRLLLVCGVTWAADAAELLALGFALPGIRADFGLSAWQGGFIASATFFGMLLGATFWGTISDRIGRRTGFQLTVAIFAVFGLASAFAPNAETLWALRFLCGFGLGGALPLDFSLMAEFLPRRDRGRWLVLLESFWAVGTVAIAALAYLIVPDHGWRPLLAASGAAALLVLWIRRRVPESPRYLVTAGRAEEAEEVLGAVARANGTEPPGPLAPTPPAPAPAVSALWRGDAARRTLMLWLAWFAIGLAYYGLFVYLPTILVDRGFSFVQTYGYALILAGAQIPGYLSAAWLVERWGRKPTLVAYLAASGVFTVLFGIVDTTALIVVSAALMSFFSLGGWAALYAYTPESYPTALRTTGMGWASAMARIAAALVTLLGAKVLSGSLEGTLVVFGAAFLAGALVVAALGRETRGSALADAAAD